MPKPGLSGVLPVPYLSFGYLLHSSCKAFFPAWDGFGFFQPFGVFFFLGMILTPLDLPPPFASAETSRPDRCGTCSKCLVACPTVALTEPILMYARKCISYLTVELRVPIPHDFRDAISQHIFGCDICQDVCPWNRVSKTHTENQFAPIKEILNFSTNDWEELTEESFKIIFKDSPLTRPKFAWLTRNLKFISSYCKTKNKALDFSDSICNHT